MKIVQRFILFFFVCGALNLNAQASIFACLENGDIALIDPMNCTSKTLLNIDKLQRTNFSFSFFGGKLSDITYSNGYLYVVDGPYFFSIDVSNNEITLISKGNFYECKGLASDNNGNIYGSGENLVKYNVPTNKFENIGKLLYRTDGDLEIKNGEIYTTSTDTSGGCLTLVNENPFFDTIVGRLNQSGNYGLTDFPDLASDELIMSRAYDLFVLNIKTGEKKLKCKNIVEHEIYGLTSGPSTLSVTNLSAEVPFTLLQNSETQQLTITLKEPSFSYTGYVLNSLGEEILDLGVITDTKTINLSELSNGLYFVKIVSSENSYFKKFYK